MAVRPSLGRAGVTGVDAVPAFRDRRVRGARAQYALGLDAFVSQEGEGEVEAFDLTSPALPLGAAVPRFEVSSSSSSRGSAPENSLDPDKRTDTS